MIVRYRIFQFRNNIRKAFNEADEGRQVIITRYGQDYQLVSLVSGPLGVEARPLVEDVKTEGAENV